MAGQLNSGEPSWGRRLRSADGPLQLKRANSERPLPAASRRGCGECAELRQELAVAEQRLAATAGERDELRQQLRAAGQMVDRRAAAERTAGVLSLPSLLHQERRCSTEILLLFDFLSSPASRGCLLLLLLLLLMCGLCSSSSTCER